MDQYIIVDGGVDKIGSARKSMVPVDQIACGTPRALAPLGSSFPKHDEIQIPDRGMPEAELQKQAL